MKISLSIQISAAPEAVFSWIKDPEKAMRWQQGVAGGEYIHKTENMVGTTFRETMEEGGNKLEMQGVVTDYVENESISFHIESRMHEFDVAYTVAGIPDGTQFSMNTDIRWKFPMNFITLIMGKKIKQNILTQTEKEFKTLKALCETKDGGKKKNDQIKV